MFWTFLSDDLDVNGQNRARDAINDGHFCNFIRKTALECQVRSEQKLKFIKVSMSKKFRKIVLAKKDSSLLFRTPSKIHFLLGIMLLCLVFLAFGTMFCEACERTFKWICVYLLVLGLKQFSAISGILNYSKCFPSCCVLHFVSSIR